MLELSTLPLEKIASSVVTQQTKNGIISLCAPIGVLLLAYLPKTIKEKYLEGKLSIRELALREEIFDKLSSAISEQIKTSYLKLEKSRSPSTILKLQNDIELLEKRLRYLSTVKGALSDLNSSDLLRVEDNEGDRSTEENATSPSWFDLFREIAERRCEPWRRELLSRAAKTELESPNAISLKTLWSLSMLDDDIFNMFTIFLESSTYLNGYPSIIPEDEEQLVHAIVRTGKNSQTTLIIVLTKLLEHGLVSNSDFQLSSIEPIIGTTLKHNFELMHHIEPSDNNAQVTLRFSGYHCTDLGMDLARLCTPPKINLHSEIGLQSLISILKETSDVEIRVGVRG